MTLEQALARYQLAYGRLQTSTVNQARALWRRFGGPGDGNVEAFLKTIIPLIEGAQVATARLVAGSFALMARIETGRGVTAAVDPATVTVAATRGVAAAEVYTRPVVTMRKALADGLDFGQAMRLAEERVDQLASTDVSMAQRQATLEVIGADDRITGYRRVLTGRSCAFCATASTQRYKRAQLAPLHSRCDCGVAPIFGDTDPGHVINRRLLKDIKSAAKTGGKGDYWRSRHFTVAEDGSIEFPPIKVRQHGELGPVLGAADHHFAGPAVAA